MKTRNDRVQQRGCGALWGPPCGFFYGPFYRAGHVVDCGSNNISTFDLTGTPTTARASQQNKPAPKKEVETKRLPSEAGLVLPMVMIFLAVMTFIGVTVIRNVTSGEKMAGNAHSQQMAFQAAEMALRICELDLQTHIRAGTTSEYIHSEFVPIPIKPEGVKTAPACKAMDISDRLVLGPTEVSKDENLHVYQVTARGTGPTDLTVVMLQSSLRFKI
ncbi:pilus assembly PilX family protein [Glaciimonas immobilis]|uniref:Tfp pilus assembly protein PilX n=1 Tax=Glaciimonas immobilis TaxID=728004 RepID=A0A840RS25_9BURK|nr:PilX N-terminal domain-containing pilus assembly protein [Glaciimonas immobilis]KAF3997697.1 hypothetical protein HAV38_13640 [Glaciimonas immobilis]MBB5200585.1 Tfp pilus assembly protein PilX [Glaciimonas immobilis]